MEADRPEEAERRWCVHGLGDSFTRNNQWPTQSLHPRVPDLWDLMHVLVWFYAARLDYTPYDIQANILIGTGRVFMLKSKSNVCSGSGVLHCYCYLQDAFSARTLPVEKEQCCTNLQCLWQVVYFGATRKMAIHEKTILSLWCLWLCPSIWLRKLCLLLKHNPRKAD